AVRERFPKLLRLDGHDLPPPITFDVETPTTLPPCKVSACVWAWGLLRACACGLLRACAWGLLRACAWGLLRACAWGLLR
ncbi:hypothetical protein FKM82_030382, partial [Ascaphus truei]